MAQNSQGDQRLSCQCAHRLSGDFVSVQMLDQQLGWGVRCCISSKVPSDVRQLITLEVARYHFAFFLYAFTVSYLPTPVTPSNSGSVPP